MLTENTVKHNLNFFFSVIWLRTAICMMHLEWGWKNMSYSNEQLMLLGNMQLH